MKNKFLENQIIIYRSGNGKAKIDVRFEEENVWLTQKLLADLFETTIANINIHLKNIFLQKELDENSVIKDFLITASDKKQYKTKHYNLDVVISVGYRINSIRATLFRQWATERLKEYIIKGFTMDDERLKDPNNTFGKDYFEEQLARIRDIRSSERRFYQKITDIYSQCSADYNPDEKITKQFFATVQNKLHFAITGQTAAEIIHARVNSKKENIGLTNWKNSPRGKIRKTDISIAKNYLNENELDYLNRIVTMYLDYAELQAKNNKIMYMKDWIKKLDAFLQFNEKDILQNNGKISNEVAIALAESEFEKYHIVKNKNFFSDFDREVKKLLKKKSKK